MKYKRFVLVGTLVLLVLSVIFVASLPQTIAGTTNFGQTSATGATANGLSNIRGARYTASVGGPVDSISAYMDYSVPSTTNLGNTASSGTSYSTSLINTIAGLRIQTPSSQVVVTSIIGYIGCTTAAKNMMAAIYSDSGTLVAASTPISVTTGTASRTFTFTSPPTLSASTYYEIVIYSQTGSGTAVLYASSNSGGAGRSAAGTYPTWPTVSTWSTNTYNYRIYCTYFTPAKIQCALYPWTSGSNTGNILGTTEEKTFTSSFTATWVTFNFVTKPTVSSSANYVLMAWSSDTSNVNLYYASGSAERFQGSGTYPTWPSTVADQSTTRQYCIYATVHNSYTITPSAGANGAINPNTPQTVNYNTNSPQFTMTPNTGYHVADVLVDGSSVGAVTTYTFNNVVADHTIAVSFAINSYAITVTQGSHGTIAPGTTNVNYGGSQTFTITADTANHYHVADVLVDGVSQGAIASYPFTNVIAAHTITASFALDTVTLTLSSGAGGSIVANPASGWHYGDVVTVTANPSTGYSFGSWGGALSGSTNPTTVTLTGDKTVSASFTANNYPLTVNVVGGGSVAKTPDQANYAFGSTVSLQANANPGYTFSGWTGDFVGTTNPYVLTIDTTPSITATFTQNTYSVSFATSGGGASTTSPTGTQSYTLNQAVPISVTAAPGYTFSTWSATGGTTFDSATTASTNAHIGGAGTITATFTVNTYTLTPSHDSHSSITPSTAQSVDYGGSKMFTYSADTGYSVSQVLVDGSPISLSTYPTSYTFSNVQGSHTIAVSAAPNSFTITVTQSGHGTIAPGTTDVTYDSNQAFTITPDTGYHIATVTVDGSTAPLTSPYTFNNVKETHTITATYLINTYAITVTQTAHGTIAGPSSVNWGTDAAYTIAPADGYSIVDVVVDGHSQGAVTSATISNVKETGHSITASYALTIHSTVLTISVDPKIANKYDSPHATVSGYLKSEGAGLVGCTVTVSYNDGRSGTWIECGSPITGAGGSYTVDFPVTPDFANGFVAFEAKFAGDAGSGYAAATPVHTGAIGEEEGNLNVLPEYIFGGLAAIGACFVGFVAFKKRSSLPHFKRL